MESLGHRASVRHAHTREVRRFREGGGGSRLDFGGDICWFFFGAARKRFRWLLRRLLETDGKAFHVPAPIDPPARFTPFPPPGRYHKLTGKSVTEGATTTANGFGFRAATAAVMAEMSASRHRLRVQTTNHAMMVVNQVVYKTTLLHGTDEEGQSGLVGMRGDTDVFLGWQQED